jgi:hypothetical protein
MADISLTMDLQAKQLVNDLQHVQTKINAFATGLHAQGAKAATGFSTGFGGIKNALTGVLGGLGVGLGVGAVVTKFEQVIEKGSRIHDIAAKFNITAEALQTIGNAAAQDGVPLEKVGQALNFLQIAGAKIDSKKISEALKILRIDAEAFKAASPDEKFLLLGDAWRSSAQGADEYNAALALVGKKNGDVLVTLDQTREAIAKISGEMGILSTHSVNALDKTGDAINKFNTRVTLGFGNAVGAIDTFDAKMQIISQSLSNFFEGPTGGGIFESLSGINVHTAWDEAAALSPEMEGSGEEALRLKNPAPNEEMIAEKVKEGGVNKAPNEEMIAEAITGTTDKAGSIASADTSWMTPEQKYLAAQGFDPYATGNINLAQAADIQRQTEAQNAIDQQIAEVNAADEQAGITPDESMENIRAGELEGQLQQDLADQEMTIANWQAGETLLTQIRDAIGGAKPNL